MKRAYWMSAGDIRHILDETTMVRGEIKNVTDDELAKLNEYAQTAFDAVVEYAKIVSAVKRRTGLFVPDDLDRLLDNL